VYVCAAAYQTSDCILVTCFIATLRVLRAAVDDMFINNQFYCLCFHINYLCNAIYVILRYVACCTLRVHPGEMGSKLCPYASAIDFNTF
jgi:hypothetical protein